MGGKRNREEASSAEQPKIARKNDIISSAEVKDLEAYPLSGHFLKPLALIGTSKDDPAVRIMTKHFAALKAMAKAYGALASMNGQLAEGDDAEGLCPITGELISMRFYVFPEYFFNPEDDKRLAINYHMIPVVLPSYVERFFMKPPEKLIKFAGWCSTYASSHFWPLLRTELPEYTHWFPDTFLQRPGIEDHLLLEGFMFEQGGEEGKPLSVPHGNQILMHTGAADHWAKIIRKAQTILEAHMPDSVVSYAPQYRTVKDLKLQISGKRYRLFQFVWTEEMGIWMDQLQVIPSPYFLDHIASFVHEWETAFEAKNEETMKRLASL